MTVSRRFFLCWPFFLTFFMTGDIVYLSNYTKTVKKLYIIIIEEGDCMDESLKADFDRHGGLMRTAELKKRASTIRKSNICWKREKSSRLDVATISIQGKIPFRISQPLLHCFQTG